MIRFFDDVDKQLFLLEVGKDINEEAEPSDHKLFIKHRKMVEPLLKDFRRSQSSKRNWVNNRGTYNFGIRRWHRSLEGRKFHRQLGRFLATHDRRERSSLLHEDLETKPLSADEKKELLLELLTESQFYHTLSDQVNIELLIEQLSAEL